jgi:CxxC motif-containing protein
MAREHAIVCIICPLACRVMVTTNDAGGVLSVANYRCKEGKEYAIAEQTFPARVLTTTVMTIGAVRPLLPVRSSKPLPKAKLLDAMRALSKVRVTAPVRMGQVISANIANTGVDIISTDELK